MQDRKMRHEGVASIAEHRMICRSHFFVAIFLSMAFIFVGCDRSAPQGSTVETPATSSPPNTGIANPIANSFPRSIVDSLQRTVTLAKRPERIVSLAPKNTEELFAIGAGDRVVGVTSYCNFPPEALRKEQVGGFSSK